MYIDETERGREGGMERGRKEGNERDISEIYLM
jgi:hypothetical protein